MFEFETHGTMEDLAQIETELLQAIGFTDTVIRKTYDELAAKYHTKELTGEHEMAMSKDISNAVLLTHFPIYTSPFWNMKKNGDHANKIDVILYGMETIGSAERSTNPEEMRKLFHEISEG